MADANEKAPADAASPKPAATFNFGSPAAAGAGAGGAAFPKFDFSKPAAKAAAKVDDEEDEEGPGRVKASSADPEAFEPDIKVTPLVSLPTIEVKTGEEDEEVLLAIRAKMFVWGEGNAGLQWKERGVGDLKLLKHKETQFVRLLMRRDKTLKICANHILTAEMVLENKLGNDRAWAYACPSDFSDHEGEGAGPSSKAITMALRFKDAAISENFKAIFEEHRDANVKLPQPEPVAQDAAGAEAEGGAEADDAAELADKLEEAKIEA